MITAPSTPPPNRRKLIPDSAAPPTDAFTVAYEYAPPTPDSHTSSPRNAVAKRLSDLNLRNPDIESYSESFESSPKRRKRIRSLDPALDAGLVEVSAIDCERVIKGSASLHKVQCNLPEDKDPQTSAIRAESVATPAIPTRRRVLAKPKPKRKQSPPSPSKEVSTKLDPHTWQEHEITGHLMQDPDDDGTGINGIGFRPTPAIAYERSQKRKMQLSAWKVRESSEARERRGERRRKLDGEFSRPPSSAGNTIDAQPDASDNGGSVGGKLKQNRDEESGDRFKGRNVRFVDTEEPR